MAEEIEVQTQEVPLDQAEMAEYRKARAEGKSVVERPVPSEEEKPEEVETAKPEASETEEEKPKEEPKKHGGGFQKRIDRLMREKAELEEKAAAAERRAKELESKAPKAEAEKPKAADGRPNQDDFKTWEEYNEALVDWRVDQKIKAKEEAEHQSAIKAKEDAIWGAHEETLKEARSKYEDFDDVVAVETPWTAESPTEEQIAAAMTFRNALAKSGMGGELMYYYGTHSDELMALGELEPEEVAAEVIILRNKLRGSEKETKKEEKPKIVSKAAPPIKPVGNSNSSRSSVPLDQMSMTDYRKARAGGRIS